MKKFLVLFMLLVSSIRMMAIDTSQVITLVSFEQQWSDQHATISLKNNLQQTVTHVEFRIVYCDLKGNQMDYTDYSRSVNIEPGMVRKIDIPGYETDRHYSYVGSDNFDMFPRFRIKFALKNYHLAGSSKKTTKTTSTHATAKSSVPLPHKDTSHSSSSSLDKQSQTSEPDVMDISQTSATRVTQEDFTEVLTQFVQDNILALIWGGITAVGLVAGLFALVIAMAINRRRNPAAWVIISILITPFPVIFLLLIFGRADAYYERSEARFYASADRTDRGRSQYKSIYHDNDYNYRSNRDDESSHPDVYFYHDSNRDSYDDDDDDDDNDRI